MGIKTKIVNPDGTVSRTTEGYPISMPTWIPPQNRPGDVLHNLLRVRYGVEIAYCRCQEWIDRMNSWGCDGCLEPENFKSIVDHLFGEATTSPEVSAIIRIQLSVPLLGKWEGKRRLSNLLREAIQMAMSAPNQSTSQEELATRLVTPAHAWPPGWRDWPNVMEYHRNLFLAELSSPAPSSVDYPTSDGGELRGIVIPSGGRCTFYDPNAPQYYFWCAFAAAWRLRHTGCVLPIEFWFLPGEMEEVEHCEQYASMVGATCHVLDVSNMRVQGGWQTKVNILLQTRLTHVMHLDSDNIVTKDPTYLFDCPQFQESAAMFWSDDPNQRDDFHHRIMPHQWSRLGVSRRDVVTDIETGQMLINKPKSAKALQMCKHLADHADYWGGLNGGERAIWYGDKTDFHVAWKTTETPHYIQAWNMFDHGFFAHVDPKGDRIFQHACHLKGHLFNGHFIQNLIGNDQIHEAAVFKSPLFFLDGSIEDSLRCLAPERMFSIDSSFSSREVWMDVFTRNEYQLPPTLQKHDTILDIGSNSGAFSYACLRRGAGKVVACEPIPDSADKTITNCRPIVKYGQDFRVLYKAVWRSDQPPTTVKLSSHERDGRSTAMSSLIRPKPTGISAKTIGLDVILKELEAVHILKIDCEGAEWPILYTSKELRRCEYILGEYHSDAEQRFAGDPPPGGWPEWSLPGLKEFLRSQGFEVYRVREGSLVHGGFWAKRID